MQLARKAAPSRRRDFRTLSEIVEISTSSTVAEAERRTPDVKEIGS